MYVKPLAMFLRLCQLGSEAAIWLLSSWHQIWLKANRMWLQGKVQPYGVAGFVGVSQLERLQLLDTLVWSLEVLVDNQVKQSSLRQGYLRWLPVSWPSKAVTLVAEPKGLRIPACKAGILDWQVLWRWWCQVHPLATTSPMDYGINCPVLILALMMWESLFRKLVFYMGSFRRKLAPRLAARQGAKFGLSSHVVQRDCMESSPHVRSWETHWCRAWCGTSHPGPVVLGGDIRAQDLWTAWQSHVSCVAKAWWGYTLRRQAAFNDLGLKVTVQEMQAFMLLKQSCLSDEDKKRILSIMDGFFQWPRLRKRWELCQQKGCLERVMFARRCTQPTMWNPVTFKVLQRMMPLHIVPDLSGMAWRRRCADSRGPWLTCPGRRWRRPRCAAVWEWIWRDDVKHSGLTKRTGVIPGGATKDQWQAKVKRFLAVKVSWQRFLPWWLQRRRQGSQRRTFGSHQPLTVRAGRTLGHWKAECPNKRDAAREQANVVHVEELSPHDQPQVIIEEDFEARWMSKVCFSAFSEHPSSTRDAVQHQAIKFWSSRIDKYAKRNILMRMTR